LLGAVLRKYEDIYNHMFKSEKDYDELYDLFAKYKVLYKKLKGRSP
jgi:predicted phosphoadenosine phosphosulfate sulfurtransferase